MRTQCIRTCRRCGTDFTMLAALAKRGQGTYCSRACKAAAQRHHTECSCRVCGASFTLPAADSTRGRGAYCSPACHNRSLRRRVERTCEHCGAAFTVHPSTVQKGFGTFCSRACRDDAKRRKIECVCVHCGATFTRWPSALLRGGGRSCTTACTNAAATIALEERFWGNVDKTDGCWVWRLATRGAQGYGTTTWQDRTYATHRLAWELTHGAIPAGMLVCHRCDNPPCCRPDHLFLGTPRDNMQDMIAKGRARWVGLRGEQTGRALLTEDRVRMVRRRHAEGETMAALARELRVSFGAIRGIVHRLNWAWLPDTPAHQDATS